MNETYSQTLARYEEVHQRVLRDVGEHEMTVLHDDGLYRHLKFRAPDTGFYWFHLITSPGLLTIHGDMGTFVFARVPDMFTFFETGRGINPGYWAEKVVAGDCIKSFSAEVFEAHAREQFADYCGRNDFDAATQHLLWQEIQCYVLDDVDDEASASEAATEFRSGDFEFTDVWEWDLTDYTTHYLWCCWAILWGIQQYRAATAVTAAEEAA